MTNSQRLKRLMDSGQTVFRPQDLQMLWKSGAHSAKISACRMAGQGLLVRVARGYYALRADYDPLELANRILSPSYISFNSALARAGVNFQARRSVDAVALLSYRRTVDGTVFSYFAMKQDLFFRPEGIVTRGGIALATPERAVLDSFYFGFIPDIDRLDQLDREALASLGALYPATVRQKARRLYES